MIAYKGLFFLCSFLIYGAALLVDKAFAESLNLAIGYDSRYISEGRDNTSEESLQHIGLNHSRGDFSAGFWYARSSFNDYEELNLSFSHQLSLGAISLTSAYTFLNFSGRDPDDHELTLALSSGDTWPLQAGLSAYYSYRSKGIYAVGDLRYPFTINPRFSLAPYLNLGANYGYVVNEHRGADHYGFGLQTEFLFADSLSLSAYITAIEPIDKASGETLIAADWWGASLSYAF